MWKKVEIVSVMGAAGGGQIITIKGMHPCSGHYAPEKTETGTFSLSAPMRFTSLIFYIHNQSTVYSCHE